MGDTGDQLFTIAGLRLLDAESLAGVSKQHLVFSPPTIDFFATFQQSDAAIFQRLMRFAWNIESLTPVVFDLPSQSIYTHFGLDLSALKRLEEIGLIAIDDKKWHSRALAPATHCRVSYFGKKARVKLDPNGQLPIGHVLLTEIGVELAPIMNSQAIPEFFDYAVNVWKVAGGKHIALDVQIPGMNQPGK